MRATVKEDVSDIRDSKVIDLYKEVMDYSLSVDLVDPHAEKEEVLHEYGIQLCEKVTKSYDVIIVAVNHAEYRDLTEEYFTKIAKKDGVLIDVKNIYRGKINNLIYWSL